MPELLILGLLENLDQIMPKIQVARQVIWHLK